MIIETARVCAYGHGGERYLTSILLPWPRASKMHTQPCTNWDRGIAVASRRVAPRHATARSLLQCSPSYTQMKSPRTADKNVGLCRIRAHLASISAQKLDPPYGAIGAAEKRRFINAPSLTSTRSFPPSRPPSVPRVV